MKIQSYRIILKNNEVYVFTGTRYELTLLILDLGNRFSKFEVV